jgi:hypothetical protein
MCYFWKNWLCILWTCFKEQVQAKNVQVLCVRVLQQITVPIHINFFKHEPGKSREIILTRNVRWVHWDHPNKSKSMDLSPLFTKVEGLNKDQKALLERAIDKFTIDNKMCSKKFTNPSNYQTKSIHSDLRRKMDDRHWKKEINDYNRKRDGPQIKRRNKKSTMKAKKTKEPVEIDEDGFILVTKKNAARRIPLIQQQPQQQAARSSSEEDEDDNEEEEIQQESEEQEDESSGEEEEEETPRQPRPRLARELRG